MTIIGTFTRNEDGFAGTITTLTLKAKANIKPVEKSSEQAPDYRVYSAGVEIGAAWSMTSKANRRYLSVKIEDPSFAAPISCRLVFADDENNAQLVWNR